MMASKRTNGFSWPPDKFQIAAWIIIIFFGLMIFGCFCVSLTNPLCYIMAILFAIVFLGHIVFNVACMAINPGEEASLKRKVNPLKEFDRSKHKHVIENQFCNICQIEVSLKAKHCKRCNKCVTHFDHHCIYLNNCIGSRNYRIFFMTIVSAFLGVLMAFTLGLVIFIDSFLGGASMDPILTNYYYLPLLFIAAPINAWRVFVVLTVLLSLVGIALIGYLIGYHIFLKRRNMTTYEHSLQLKNRAQEKQQEFQQQQQQQMMTTLKSTTTIKGDDNRQQLSAGAVHIKSTTTSSNAFDSSRQQPNGVTRTLRVTPPPAENDRNFSMAHAIFSSTYNNNNNNNNNYKEMNNSSSSNGMLRLPALLASKLSLENSRRGSMASRRSGSGSGGGGAVNKCLDMDAVDDVVEVGDTSGGSRTSLHNEVFVTTSSSKVSLNTSKQMLSPNALLMVPTPPVETPPPLPDKSRHHHHHKNHHGSKHQHQRHHHHRNDISSSQHRSASFNVDVLPPIRHHHHHHRPDDVDDDYANLYYHRSRKQPSSGRKLDDGYSTSSDLFKPEPPAATLAVNGFIKRKSDSAYFEYYNRKSHEGEAQKQHLEEDDDDIVTTTSASRRPSLK